MEVRLNVHIGKSLQVTPLGVAADEEALGIWRVDVYDDAFKGPPLNLAAGFINVGTIGRQSGANFCANDSFSRFSTDQKKSIVDDIKRLHGSASQAEPVELTEEIVEEDDDDFDDDE